MLSFLSENRKEKITAGKLVMNRRIGNYITQKVAQESYKAYVPPKLPPEPALDWKKLHPHLDKATRALAELNNTCQGIPNTSLFIYMYVRKEALLSSQIEGTQSSFSDLMLFEHHQKPNVSLEDVEEVSHYVQAIAYGLKRLREDFPLSLRLLREIHGILLSGGRGVDKLPGEFRRSQNWIGGTRPGNALFVPPPMDHLHPCLWDFENFLHDNSIPSLIKAGLAHVQFETIHPFLDGNGRLGRLLITLLLCHEDLLNEPILYLSLYFKKNRTTYYELLQAVRLKGEWETWLVFFLEGVCESAKQAISTATRINRLFENDFAKISTLGRARFSCEKIIEYMKHLPHVTAPLLARELNITTPTARAALNRLVTVGILEHMNNKRRDRVYIYRQYLTILETDSEPL